MATWFVTRHQGAKEWATKNGIDVDHFTDHLELLSISDNDIVIGNLPIQLVSEICKKNARYLHLSLDLAPDMRGKELTSEDMRKANARLEEYHVQYIADRR